MIIIGFEAFAQRAINPIVHADVPDPSIIRVGDAYYMSSTTMHMSPGLPIMKSMDLVNWELLNYAYEVLDCGDDLALDNGKSMYGKGSWASSLRYYNGTFYVSTFSGNTNKTYIYTTDDIESGNWKATSFSPSLHDHSLFFEDDKVYMIWGGGEIKIVELNEDLSGIKGETEQVLVAKAHAPIEKEIMLHAEGSQIFKIDGNYYLFNIAWPRGGMRTVLIHKAENLFGPYEGRVALEDKGVAQGGLIDTPDGDWYAYLFRDFGAVGRIPYMVPVTWEQDWPILGVNGQVPMELAQLPAQKTDIPSIVASDNFKRAANEPDLPLVWQWNHTPVDKLWSIDREQGLITFQTDRIDESWLSARNSLTQRTFGPTSAAEVTLHVDQLKEGDVSGLGLLQKHYGWIGIKIKDGQKVLQLELIEDEQPVIYSGKTITSDRVRLKAYGDFQDRKDLASFFYSEDDGKTWTQLGPQLKMSYTLPHFMGYRFALFYYATSDPGGQVDFSDFNISQ
ncbi:glycoside hydrolase family 43 protein [Mongoliitalea daihaiensis]|uniref:glycoside hydrolase family 43 protein n=1 Tax=Mongoliitalea daihaiensis TaxID=2782006 RepID=UPI001F16DF29|nr:glycoside hydrolase 43 family protein [Mongoliitalea daihaiensis]